MSIPGRLVLAGIIALIVCLDALYMLNVLHPRLTMKMIDGRRTWIVRAERHTVALPRTVGPDDGLVCVLDGADLRVEHLVDLYLVPGSGRRDDGKLIWIEGERIESPPEGAPPKRGVFDREPMGTVFITCGVKPTID